MKIAALVALFAVPLVAHAAPVRRDATARMNALRTVTPTQPVHAIAKLGGGGYKPVAFSMSVPDALGHAPTSADVTINRGLDGRSPTDTLAMVRSKSSTPIAAQNDAFVNHTILDVHKAFTIAVNNAFTVGSPTNAYLAKTFPGAEVSGLGVMSAVHPTVIMARQPGERVARFYARGDDGTFAELPTLPYSVIMKARLQNGTAGGVRVSYQTWSQPQLGGPLGTVSELGSAPAPANATQ